MRPRPVHRLRNRWGGHPPRPRPEQWFECHEPCGRVAYRNDDDSPLVPMSRQTGDRGPCPFCGEEDESVISRPREHDGRYDWWDVCLACGTSNPCSRPEPPGWR